MLSSKGVFCDNRKFVLTMTTPSVISSENNPLQSIRLQYDGNVHVQVDKLKNFNDHVLHE